MVGLATCEFEDWTNYCMQSYIVAQAVVVSGGRENTDKIPVFMQGAMYWAHPGNKSHYIAW